MRMKTDEEINELFRRWGKWQRTGPGVGIGMKIQKLEGGKPPKQYVKKPPYRDPESEDLDKLIASLCSEHVVYCLIVKYVWRYSNPQAAEFMGCALGTYKAIIKDAKLMIKTAFFMREEFQESA